MFLSIGVFINQPQWQAHDDGILVRGIGGGLEPEHVAWLAEAGASFDIDIYVNTETEEEDEDAEPDE